MHPSTRRHGFTLAELAIVLVIIGLLIGGILAGKSLIRAAEVRSVVADFDNYNGAITAFKEKYNALPGDMKNATDYWATDTGCPNTGWDGVKKVATCNGNGDGHVSTWVTGWADFYEMFRFWQHLSNAGLINGMYVGTSISGVQGVAAGLNAPKSRVPNAVWSTYPLDLNYPGGDTWDNNYRSPLLLSSRLTSGGYVQPILSGTETWKIDTKIDDGKPGYGIVSVWRNSMAPDALTRCLTNDTRTTADYVRDDKIRCMPIFQYD